MNILKRMRRMAKFTAEQVADYLGISQSDYSRIEQKDVNDCPFDSLEKLAALYHVEEYDLLTGTAVPHTLCGTPAQEEDLIPFFTLVNNYLKICRLLADADRSDTRFRISWQ